MRLFDWIMAGTAAQSGARHASADALAQDQQAQIDELRDQVARLRTDLDVLRRRLEEGRAIEPSPATRVPDGTAVSQAGLTRRDTLDFEAERRRLRSQGIIPKT